MQRCPVPPRFTQYIRIVLLVTVFLSGVLPVTLVHANDGDFVWAKSMGAEESDQGHAITVDNSGSIYTTGSFKGTVDFDPGPGIFNLTSAGTTNAIFISKLDSNGNFLWAKAIGGQVSCIGHGIAVDTSGNVYTTGFFWNTIDFDPGPGTFDLTSAGWSDIFVCKLDTNGDFVWAKAMGGTLYDNGYGISVDTSGNVYITGYFQGTADFDPGPGTAQLTSAGELDIFISKLDTNGDFVWAGGIGGTIEDRGYGLSIDTSGNVYTTGFFQGTVDFDPGPGTFDLINASGYDIFVSKLDTTGDFVWAKAMGGTLDCEGRGLFIDTSGNVYSTGYFRGAVDFDPGDMTTEILTSIGSSQDIFVSKLDTNGDFVWAKAMGGTLNDNGYGISVDTSGNVYSSGYFQDTADFNPGTGIFDLISEGANDIFVSKLDTNGDFVWAKAMGGTLGEYGKGISVDTSGNAHITGYFQGTVDFDPGPGTFNLTSAADSDDIFIVLLSAPPPFPWFMFLPAITNQTAP
jgi:hypothetical protein